MKNKNIFLGISCALFSLTFLTDTFGQNPILKSTTTTSTTIGAAASVLTEKANYVGLGTINPVQPLTIYSQEKDMARNPGDPIQIGNTSIIRISTLPYMLSTTYSWDLIGSTGFKLHNPIANNTPMTVKQSGEIDFLGQVNLSAQAISSGTDNRLGFLTNASVRRIFWTSYASGTNNVNMPLEFLYDGMGSGSTDVSVMTLMPTGKVGIGTAAPSEKLEVSGGNVKITNGRLLIESTSGLGTGNRRIALNSDGTIRAREILVDLVTIPDYVFADTYPLMSIEELSRYIAEHKHLPGIASEKEYQAEGAIKIGELNMQLLEKVEELTLYVIQMQKEINELKNQKVESEK